MGAHRSRGGRAPQRAFLGKKALLWQSLWLCFRKLWRLLPGKGGGIRSLSSLFTTKIDTLVRWSAGASTRSTVRPSQRRLSHGRAGRISCFSESLWREPDPKVGLFNPATFSRASSRCPSHPPGSPRGMQAAKAPSAKVLHASACHPGEVTREEPQGVEPPRCYN